MAKPVKLLHSLHRSRLAETLQNGIKALSAFDDLGVEIRQGVVYCWLCRADDKRALHGQQPDHIYLEVTVDESRCTVADMEYSSLALMYRQGWPTKPKNEQAAQLFAQIYQVTSVPLAEYTPGIFFTPEVLVKGDIAPEDVRVTSGLE